MTMHYTYVLLSKRDSGFYTGCTNDVKRRILEHNSGRVRSCPSSSFTSRRV